MLTLLILWACADAPEAIDTGILEAENVDSGTPAPDEPEDADHDGYDTTTDCDDEDPTVHPGSVERCDGLDNDCNGVVDDDPNDGEAHYVDGDGDGYGDPDSLVRFCERQEELTVQGGDCDDSDASIHPDASERCDGVDTDCDPTTGEDGRIHLSSTDQDYKSIEDAVDASVEGDELLICPGVYYENIVTSHSLTLTGLEGPEVTVIDGGLVGSVITGAGDLTVSGLTLQNGAGNSGGIDMWSPGGTLTLSDCEIRSCYGYQGGAVALGEDHTLVATDCLFEDNQASDSGGALAGADLALEGVVISGNSAKYGGALYLDASQADATVTMVDTEITANWSTGSSTVGNCGGAVFGYGDYLVTVSGGVIKDNVSDRGGGLCYLSGTARDAGLLVQGVTLSGNHGGVGGGAVYLSTLYEVTFEDSVIEDNYAEDGGGFWQYGSVVTLERTIVRNNGAVQGGGYYQLFGWTPNTLNVIDSEISGNYADVGGGMYLGPGVTSENTDWGSGATNNSPEDITGLLYFGDSFDYGSGASFVCGTYGDCQ